MALVCSRLRLLEPRLKRVTSIGDAAQLHEQRPVDVRVLGDLSGFPILCNLSYGMCGVKLCEAARDAVRHASFTLRFFSVVHFQAVCMLAVLQLSQALWRLRSGSMLRALYKQHYAMLAV